MGTPTKTATPGIETWVVDAKQDAFAQNLLSGNLEVAAPVTVGVANVVQPDGKPKAAGEHGGLSN